MFLKLPKQGPQRGPIPSEPYVPHRSFEDVTWIVRDPEYEHLSPERQRALVSVAKPNLPPPRKQGVRMNVYLDFPADEKVGLIDPAYPILSGALYPTGSFVKGGLI